MNTDSLNFEIIRMSVDAHKPSILLESSWITIAILVFIILMVLLIKFKLLKKFHLYEMEVKISGSPEVTFKVERNDENLYIANRIYIELITRKAAILLDEKNDVIEEVYNSWYSLFGIIRNEIKTLPGKYLRNHDATSALIGLTARILNDGLRPHLTKYQAKFRSWYTREKGNPINANLTPQEIQRNFPGYNSLITSMKEVNIALIDYSKELEKLIKG
jgi:hypothetical protein